MGLVEGGGVGVGVGLGGTKGSRRMFERDTTKNERKKQEQRIQEKQMKTHL